MTEISAKLDDDLVQALQALPEDGEIEVLVHPRGGLGDLENYLAAEKAAGNLEFNILGLAHCAVVRASATGVKNIAARDDVNRVTLQPRVSTHLHGRSDP